MTLPNFLVIGAYKSGTTALQHALRGHPQVFIPERKGPVFFAFDGVPDDSNPAAARSVKTLEEYERLFEPATGEPAIGDVSPEYLANPNACGRIKARIPDAKLVAILRNPVERAYSDYLMYVRDGQEHADFAMALDEQDVRYAAGLPTGYYVRTGFFGRQLRAYFEAFPREQLQVHLFDDFARDPASVLAAMFEFLGVDPEAPAPAVERDNVSGIPRNAAVRTLIDTGRRLAPALPGPVRRRAKGVLARGLDRPDLPAAERRRLVEIYRDDVGELEALLGRPLEHWLAG